MDEEVGEGLIVLSGFVPLHVFALKFLFSISALSHVKVFVTFPSHLHFFLATRAFGRPATASCFLELVQRVSVFDYKFGYGRPAQRLQMCPAAGELSHVMSDRAHVSARGHARLKISAAALHRKNFKLLDFNLN